MCRSTCFGRLHAHHQELTTALTASGFTLERGGSSVVGRGLAGYHCIFDITIYGQTIILVFVVHLCIKLYSVIIVFTTLSDSLGTHLFVSETSEEQ
jgi:hypothetical protein